MIEKILKLCKEVKQEKVEKGYCVFSYLIKKLPFIFEASNFSWSTNTTLYELRVYIENNPEPLERFKYLEEKITLAGKEGDKRVKDCFSMLQKKWIDWDDYKIKLEEYEEKQMKIKKERQREKDLRELRGILN